LTLSLISGGAGALPPAMAAYEARFDADEQENITIYERAAQAVVTINALVNGHPSSGAGVLIDPAGVVLTSRHVVGNASRVLVSLENGQKLQGALIGQVGDDADLAVIKIQSDKALPYLELGDSSKARVGQKVLAIGNPYGFERTLTLGIISRIDKTRNRIQTDAAINPGNSGGPLLDNQGYIIGINQSIYNPDGNRSNIGIGFAVPVNAARGFLKRLASEPALPRSVATRSLPTPDDAGTVTINNALRRFATSY
jgi:serine protease Do